jgi:hypothetical protein
MNLEELSIAPGLTMADVAQVAGQAGAKAFAEAQEKARRTEKLMQEAGRKAEKKRIIRNVKLLMINYRSLRSYLDNAVYEAKLVEDPLKIIEELMMPDRDGTIVIESIKRSVARTATIVDHVEKMVKLYRADCYIAGTPEAERRWRVIDALYISDEKKTVKELAVLECVEERTIYNDVNIALERLSVFIFGVDGIKK